MESRACGGSCEPRRSKPREVEIQTEYVRVAVRGEAILAGATVGSLHATDSSWSFADGVLELGFVRGESARACSDFNLLFKRFQVSSCRCSTFNMLAGQFWLSKSAVVTCSRFLEVH